MLIRILIDKIFLMEKKYRLRKEISLGKEFWVDELEASWLKGFQLRKGKLISLCDKRGRWFRARVVERQGERIKLLAFEELGGRLESRLFSTLVQAIPNKERMELIIEKAVELGVDLIQPVFTLRSYQLSDLPQKKWHRWQERARRASEQCRRGTVPLVLEPGSLKEVVGNFSQMDLKIVLWEREKERGLKEVLEEKRGAKSVVLVNGPEGGLEQEEVEFLNNSGFISASLGARILRTETSAIIGLGLVQFYLGDLGEITWRGR